MVLRQQAGFSAEETARIRSRTSSESLDKEFARSARSWLELASMMALPVHCTIQSMA